MGKITGFLEFGRNDRDYEPVEERVKHWREFVLPLSRAFGRLQQATVEVARRGLGDPFEAGAAAADYLRLFGLTALAHAWARMAEVALDKAAQDATGFYAAKLGTARFFMQRLLPQTGALSAAIMAGGASMRSFEDAAF